MNIVILTNFPCRNRTSPKITIAINTRIKLRGIRIIIFRYINRTITINAFNPKNMSPRSAIRLSNRTSGRSMVNRTYATITSSIIIPRISIPPRHYIAIILISLPPSVAHTLTNIPTQGSILNIGSKFILTMRTIPLPWICIIPSIGAAIEIFRVILLPSSNSCLSFLCCLLSYLIIRLFIILIFFN